MSDISETEWKKALISILEELSRKEYNKLLEILDKIPESQKAGSKQKMPQIIIQCYGLEGSITAIDEAMKIIPRLDSKIQDLLQPYVKKLKAKQEEENRSKRKALDPQTEEETAANKMKKLVPEMKEQTETGGAVPVRSESTMADQPAMETPSWRRSIRDLKDSKEILLTDAIGGKVIYKSPLHTSKTQTAFFIVLVTDETAGLYLVVYGNSNHRKIKKGNYYSFRKLKRDEAGPVKVTSESIVAQTFCFNIPEEVEKEVCSNSPSSSIKHIKTLDSGTGSITGTITEINLSKRQRKKTEKRQSFHIKDDTDSIEVVFWGDKTQQCKNLSVGDVIVLNKMKINQQDKTVSLQSTSATDIIQVYKVGSRNVKFEIVAIIEAQKKQTQLEVYLGDQKNQTLMVASKLLAEAFDLTLDKNFNSQLVSALPMLAEAVIEGNEIKRITRIQN